MANIIIGTEKTFKHASLLVELSDDVFVVSAFGYNSQISKKPEYFIESCSIVDPRTGSAKSSNPFENLADFQSDNLYPDSLRFKFTESSVANFHNTFPDCELQGSELAVALTAHISQQRGYSPWVIVQPDEEKLIEFCRSKGWGVILPGLEKDGVPQCVEEIISNLIPRRDGGGNILVSRSEK